MLTNISINDTQLEDIITSWLGELTGLDPNKGQVRIAYGQDNYPSWSHRDSVVAFYMQPVDDTLGEDLSKDYNYNQDKFDETIRFTQVYDCLISVYGPNCKTLATLIRTNFLLDSKRLNLSKNNIYPVLKTPPANYLPYEFNSQWWQRCDVTIRMNVYTVLTSQVEKIQSVNIKVITKETGEKDVNIVS